METMIPQFGPGRFVLIFPDSSQSSGRFIGLRGTIRRDVHDQGERLQWLFDLFPTAPARFPTIRYADSTHCGLFQVSIP